MKPASSLLPGRWAIVHHLGGAHRVQPGDGARGVDVDVGAPVQAVALAAGLAQAARERDARFQRLRQHVGAPAFAAHLGAEALVLGVGQAERVAVREQQALALQLQHRGSGRPAMPVATSVALPSRKSRLPTMKATKAARRLGQQVQRLGLKGRLRASSPSQISNRSPRITTASAGVSRRWRAKAAWVRGSAGDRCRSDRKSTAFQAAGACHS
ncbi:MAG: hypothetical protein U1F50_17330 [Rubrivivax sp.]